MNAREEFLRQVGSRGLICARVQFGNHWLNKLETFCLKKGYGPIELEAFLKTLDFEYDHRAAREGLAGFIWHTDTAWSERQEYDGRESWAVREIPKIPEELSGREN